MSKPTFAAISGWTRRHLENARYALTAEEIFSAALGEHNETDFYWMSFVLEVSLYRAIVGGCRDGTLIAQARRPGVVAFERVPPEEWAYLGLEMSNCGRKWDEPCGLAPLLGCERHEKRHFQTGRRVPVLPTGRLVRERSKKPEWELTIYSNAASANSSSIGEPSGSIYGRAPGLRSAVEEVVRDVGRPGRGGIRWKPFEKQVYLRCGVDPKKPPPRYSSRTIRRVATELANSLKK